MEPLNPRNPGHQFFKGHKGHKGDKGHKGHNFHEYDQGKFRPEYQDDDYYPGNEIPLSPNDDNFKDSYTNDHDDYNYKWQDDYPFLPDYNPSHGELESENDEFYYYANPKKAIFFAGPRPTRAYRKLEKLFSAFFKAIQFNYDTVGISTSQAKVIGEAVLGNLGIKKPVTTLTSLPTIFEDADVNAQRTFRVTVVYGDGTVLYDTYAYRYQLNITSNYNNYPEILSSILNGGQGFATRIDPLSQILTKYIAKAFFLQRDRTQYFVVRLSVGFYPQKK